MLKPIEIVVGGGGPNDPAANTTDCVIPSLQGEVIWIEKIGYGTYDYDKYTTLSNGGFRLIGTTFSAGERFYVHRTGVSYGTNATSYTNGFDLGQVMNTLFGRIGWKQPYIGTPVLSGMNLVSKSGRFFNDGSFHAALTVANIKSTYENGKANDGDINTYLETFQRGAIMRTLTKVFNRPEYISQGLLFSPLPWGNKREVVESTTDFVGIEFYLPPLVDKAVRIDQFSIYLNQTKTFTMYLYNTLLADPIATVEVNAQANTQVLVNVSDLVMSHNGPLNQGGCFYFGYYQSDLGTARAYNTPNKSQDHSQFFRWRFMESNKISGTYDFNREEIGYSSLNYGLNVHVTAFVDHTQQARMQASLFDNAVGLQAAAMVLEMLTYGSSSNSTERKMRESIPAAMLLQDIAGIQHVRNVPTLAGLMELCEIEFTRLRDAFYGKPEAVSMSLC